MLVPSRSNAFPYLAMLAAALALASVFLANNALGAAPSSFGTSHIGDHLSGRESSNSTNY